MVVGYLVAGDEAASVIPSLLLFVLVLNRMMPKVKEFNQARMDFVNTLPAAKHVAGFLRTEDKSYTRKGGIRLSELGQEVRFENVGFKYPDSDESALVDVNFRIAKGETVALVGASGAGKSTLADLFLGLHDPTGGRILVDGIDLRQLDLRDWRRLIGVVDQEVFLLNSSIRDNIAFAGSEYSNEDIVKAARAAYADTFIGNMPEGYDTVVGDRGFRLSGGQQQRVAIARALVRNPDILVLDEATSALDTGSEQIIQQTLKELHHQRTILIIAHRLSTLSHADKIIVLERGHVVEQGSWEELVNKSGVFADLWSMQSGHSADG
jgi:ABC-type multidrug transport system fused ATPase/permease subunit